MKDFYEDYDEYVKDNGELFDAHVLDVLYRGDENTDMKNDMIVDWRCPDDGALAMRFVYIGGVLNINGDAGYCVLNWYNPRNHLLAHRRFGFFYAMRKLVAMPNGGLYGFSEDKAHNDFCDVLDDRVEGGYISEEERDEVKDSLKNCSIENEFELFNFIEENKEMLGDDLWESGVYECGQYVKRGYFLIWYGFQCMLAALAEVEL